MIPKASLILKICLVTVAVAVASCSTVPERAPASTPSVALFKGVSHQTLPATGPVPMAIHVLRIDLSVPGVSLVVTPGDPSEGHEYRALKTSEALLANDWQAAVNGGYFLPLKAAVRKAEGLAEGSPVEVLLLPVALASPSLSES